MGSIPITLLAAEEERQPLIPYEVGIKDYNSEQDFLKQLSLLCLFSADEAKQLAGLLKEKEGYEAEVEEVEMPIDSIWPWFMDMDSTCQGFIGVSEQICSAMGLRIAAYFDVRDSEKWNQMNS